MKFDPVETFIGNNQGRIPPRSFHQHAIVFLCSLSLTITLGLFTNLAHTAEVKLTWNRVIGADGYKIYYGFESRRYHKSENVGGNTQHRLQLDPGTYFFSISAYNTYGESGFSDEVSATIRNTTTIDWANMNGNVSFNGSPVCTMVLANGQYRFTCSGDGSFNMDVPLDDNGQITVFVFCTGLAPFKQAILPAEGQGLQIELEDADKGPGMNVDCTVQEINSTRVRLKGTVSFNGLPVCAMVLANGQYMFSCSGDGSFSLDVPLNDVGGVTLSCFCSGLPPYQHTFMMNQISLVDNAAGDGYSITEVGCHDLDAGIDPGTTEICGDGIDQDCDGEDPSCLTYELLGSSSGVYALNGSTFTLTFSDSNFATDAGPHPGMVVKAQILSVSETTMIMLEDGDEPAIWQRDKGQAGDILGTWTKIDNEIQVLDINTDMTFSYTAYISRFTVPYGTITIDGLYDDWQINHRVYLDTDGPECDALAGLDLKEVSLAQDETHIYLRFVLNGSLDSTCKYQFGNPSRMITVTGDNTVYFDNAFGWPQASLPQDSLHINGNQFECRFYKSDVDDYWGDSDDLSAWLGKPDTCEDYVDMPILEFGFESFLEQLCLTVLGDE